MNHLTFAFYNVENFYARHDFSTDQPSYIIGNKQKWNDSRYAHKLTQISTVLYHIGRQETNQSPAVIGLAEIENESVLEDLITHPKLKNQRYDYVFYDSLDERKINVAFLYKKEFVEILHSKPLRLVFKDANGLRSYTRDILTVKTKLGDEIVYFFVLHLPSKRDAALNLHKRALLLQRMRSEIDQIFELDADANLVIMGDFNDTPTNSNLIDILQTRAVESQLVKKELFNPFVKMMRFSSGTLVYKKQWLIFDQMLFSKSFVSKSHSIRWQTSKIFNPNPLLNLPDNERNNPIRTYDGKKYMGGPSDHFPIFSIISLKFAFNRN
ncbi:endonuclease/exonuclease/phosphatase family protein [Vaginella massiliensis]|uniref:endonuclease/exonuclease/phosphatase family protein n=1 Tax=Vaginella massiliensis TaxID=1816680 RepID=UPI000837F46F|nr:hypothetical protein [Vaginella massiliensis]